ncbi:MAG: SIS domain-containing protein [Alphaproteobacteria bacterium]|nr:SIS domain-containing protein [Alphaproteobacteria bacterium]
MTSKTSMPAEAAATRMYQEAREAPLRVADQIAASDGLLTDIAAALGRFRPRLVLTSARGSSDNAATYARYLLETQLGLVTASASPSVTSVYGARQDLSDCLFLVLSQSGKSPDLLAAAAAAKKSGAMVLGLVNAEDSPLAALADHVIPLKAGPELSVAATKSFICTLSALLHLTARWGENAGLSRALDALPAQLDAAWQCDWQTMVDRLRPAQSLFVLGRGLGLAVAQEAALKFKETCGLHAEAFSSAEVKHGPMALLEKKLPVLAFAQNDETRPGLESLAREWADSGVNVLLAGRSVAGVGYLPLPEAEAAVAPLLFAQAFYRWTAILSVARGYDPDHPPHLKKVTETI